MVHDMVQHNLEHVMAETTLKGDNPTDVFNTFEKMERASDRMFEGLDQMLMEYKG